MGHPALDIPPREKGQARPPIFVHSLIDDLDLTLEAFRIYAHLARRWGDGTHDSVGSYRKLGEHCFRASFPCASPATLKRKAIAAIQELEENGLIEKHKHQGNDGRDISNSYTLRTSEEIKAFQGTSHPNVIPFPYPSETIHPPVQYHCFKEGTTTKGSNTKTPLSASTSVEENFFTEVAVTETQKTSPHQPLSLVRNESEQTECSAKVEEKVKPRLDGQCLSKSPIGKAPFQSLEEMNAFQLALTEFARATGKRSPCGFAQSILNQMRSTGYEHPYWQEWKQGRAIGTHETQEWEAQPGQPYPYFLDWLAEQLKRNQDSEAQALQQANWICSNPQHAKPHLRTKDKRQRTNGEEGIMAITDNRTLLFIQSGATIESRFRECYGFTPTSEQIDTLYDADCTAVFSQLNASWQGIDTLAQKIGLSEKRVTQALKKLSQADLAMGSENALTSFDQLNSRSATAWLRNFSLDDVEEARLSLLQALNEPMMVNDWMQRFDIAHRKPFQSRWNAIDLQAAIALLIQEGLIQYDAKTGQYERQVEVQEKDSKSVTLAEIRIDGGTQPRTELNQAIIAEYGELLAEGVHFPAITVYFDGVNYWLADGFHRYWAAKQANTELAVNLIEGSQRDAILHSVGANANHGLRRSNEDKRKAVTTLLLDEEWCQWSDRAIARQCQVSDRFVNKIRKELSADHSICEYSQMKANHTRKVKRGEQVYEQLQQPKSSVAKPKPTDVEEKPMQRPSIIPEVHPEVHDTICRFLDLEAEPKPNQFVQSHDRAYLIANENPDEFNLMFERLFAQLEGQKINSA